MRDITVNFKVTKKSMLGVEYETVETIIYQDVLGYTFETVEELDNKMCIVIHFGDNETATLTCENVIGIESL